MAKRGLGQRLREARERLVLTQEELAAELGLSARSLQEYENERSVPRQARMRQLLAWLEEQERVAA